MQDKHEIMTIHIVSQENKLYTYATRKLCDICTQSNYYAHTTPLFKGSKVLRFDDLYKLDVGKFIYDGIHDTLSKVLSAFHTPNALIHSHATRQRYNLGAKKY